MSDAACTERVMSAVNGESLLYARTYLGADQSYVIAAVRCADTEYGL